MTAEYQDGTPPLVTISGALGADGWWGREGILGRYSTAYSNLTLYHTMLQTKGVMYTGSKSDCPTGLEGWRFLDSDLQWRDEGSISVTCHA